ncbi:PREDICTED: nitrate reductase [NAD(P)H]-like isoform X3 [Polistes dominula]|uniref:Nitrate reductase [NAD(P)H]-like isoform X3 n=1 Tax=Polistes dominula TaxID=743375 RepID=A0ABM1I2N2_POLDO|nr:PREDICTED: nitrate reductase [NAD(P)H]-like isoform X3 [Polistes dominula]
MSIEKESSLMTEQENSTRMDLLGLTFRTMDLKDSEKKCDSFVCVNKEQTSETSSNVTSKEKASRKSKRNEDGNKLSELRCISLDEVAWHDTPDSIWIVIYDYVYDCTELLKNHPGGQDVLLEYAGRDATLSFFGAGHSKIAQETLKNYLIGVVIREESYKQSLIKELSQRTNELVCYWISKRKVAFGFHV